MRARLAREVVGTANVDAQLDDGLTDGPGHRPGHDRRRGGGDHHLTRSGPKEELPVLYLRVRTRRRSGAPASSSSARRPRD